MTDMETRFDEGIQAYEQGDYVRARELFQEVVLVKPYTSEVHLNLGNTHFKLGEDAAAEASFRQAIELDPLESNAYLNLGNLYFKNNRVEEAVSVWEIFKKLDRVHANIWLNLGIAYDRLGDPEKALENYSGFCGRSPASSEAISLKQRFERSKQVFENNVQVAEVYLERGERVQAQNILGKALAAYPGTARIYKTYASLLYQAGHYPQALENYRCAHRLAPEDQATLVNLGVLYEKLGQPISALWAYHQAKEYTGPEQGKVIQRFENLLAQYQSKLPDSLTKAQTLFRQGKLAQAETLINQLVALSAYWQDGGQEARLWQDKIQEAQDPSHKAAKNYIARAHDAETKGQFDHALNFYKRYLALKPDGEHAAEAKSRVTQINAIMAAAVRSFLDSP